MSRPVFDSAGGCHFCALQQLLGPRHAHCPKCGAPWQGGQRIGNADAATSHGGYRMPSTPPKPRFGLGFTVALVLGSVCLCGVLSSLLFWNRQAAFSVVREDWSRTVSVEAFGPVNDSAWCDQLPVGASDVQRHREQRSTKQVPNGEDCQVQKVADNTGTVQHGKACVPKFKEQPVYDDKCDFQSDTWHSERTAEAHGQDIVNVHWPDARLKRLGSCVGCEREGARAETYTVVFQDGKAESFSCNFAQPWWSTFAVGTQWNGQIKRGLGSVDCASLVKR